MSSRTKIGQLAVHQRQTKTAKGNIKTYYYARGTVRFNTEKESVDEILKGITSISQAEIETQNVEIRWLKSLKDRYLDKNPDFMTFGKMSNHCLLYTSPSPRDRG